MSDQNIHSFEYDREYLKSLVFSQSEGDKKVLELLEIPGPLTAEKMLAWLDERVKIIVSPESASNIYPCPGTTTYPLSTYLGGNAEGAVAGNSGEDAYAQGKKGHFLGALNFPARDGTSRYLYADTPRIGVIQLFGGYFSLNNRANRDVQDTPANAIIRLAELFHEGRHSDGHGKSLGFDHVNCALGEKVCDLATNGGYAVQTAVLASLNAACDQACKSEQFEIRMHLDDSASRNIPSSWNGDGQVASHYDTAPEKIASYTAPGDPLPVVKKPVKRKPKRRSRATPNGSY